MGEAVTLNSNSHNHFRLKTNLTVWVFYSSDRFHLHISQELANCDNLSFETISLHSLVVANLAHFSPPDLIFVETGPNWAQKVMELQHYEAPQEQQDNHEASLIVFGNENDNGALKIALKIGAADFISDRVVLSEMMPMFKNAVEDKLASRSIGDMYAFVNTKGGAGASMLAVNTAIEMAKVYPEKVLLLDLDLQFGVANDYLNISSSYGLADAIANVSDMDEMSLASYVTKHKSGLHMLTFKPENGHDNYDKAKNFNKLLPVLREVYPYVIVDLSRGLDRIFTSVIVPANKVFLVTQQNLVAVKNSARIIKTLTFEFGLSREQIELVVNRYEKRQSIKLKDISETLPGVKVHMIPNDFKAAVESANLGKPYVQSKKNSSLAKSVIQFTRTLVPETEQKLSWIKRLFS